LKEEKLQYGKLYTKKFTLKMFVYRCRLAIKNFILIAILTTISLYFIGDSFFSFESIAIWKFAFLFFLMVAIDDVWFYSIHRLMHTNKFLYKKIHSVHHQAVPPIPMDFLFAHPIEALGAAFGLILGVLVLIFITGNANIYVLVAYSFYRTMHELEVHSGFQIIPEKYLGFIGSSKHHFNHHKYHKGNYASAFTYLDKIFGTEVKEKMSQNS
jgi:methylsterol monooxygenase